MMLLLLNEVVNAPWLGQLFRDEGVAYLGDEKKHLLVEINEIIENSNSNSANNLLTKFRNFLRKAISENVDIYAENDFETNA